MAIYRPPKARWPLALTTGVLGLVVGLITGWVVATTEPDPREAGREIKGALVAAAGSLEVASIEYEESVADGEVLKEAEYEGALSALDNSRARYDSVRPVLASLFPSQVEPVDALYGEAERLMRSRSDVAEVRSVLQELEAVLKGEAK